MPDTKSGRERKGRNKRRQLETHLNEQEIDTLDGDTEPPEFGGEPDSEFLANPDEVERATGDDD